MNEKKVFNNICFALGYRRLSIDTNQFNVPLSRKDVDLSAFEDVAERHGKGPQGYTIDFSGFGSVSQTFLLQQLAANEVPTPITLLLDSDTRLSPAAAVGTTALIMDGIVNDVQLTIARAAGNAFKATLACQQQLSLGLVLFCNVGAAALTTGTTNGADVIVPALTPGNVMTISYHVVSPPGVDFVTTPSTTGTNISAASSDNSFNRSSGSFVTDGWSVGQVLGSSGWSANGEQNNGSGITIVSVTATKMVVSGITLFTESAGQSVTLSIASQTTINTIVQSSVDNTFASPITRATFDQLTLPGQQIIYVDGDQTPISDTHFRASIVVAGPVGPPAPACTIMMGISVAPK